MYCGGDYSFIETMDHQIYSFGKNKIGQLGIGDCVNTRIAIPTRVQIHDKTNCFVTKDSSSSIRMTTGATLSTSSSFSPFHAKNVSQEASPPLPPMIALPPLPPQQQGSLQSGHSLGPVKLISCGWQSTFILFENDHLYVCGDNSHQCHVPSSSSAPNNHNNPSSSSSLQSSSPSQHNFKPIISPQRKQEKFSFQRIEIQNLYASSPNNKIKDIQVGLFHTGILMENGEVWISCPCCCSPIELERRKFKKKSFIDKNGKLIVTEYGNDLLKSFKIMHMAYLSTFLGTPNDVVYVSGINYCGSLGVGSTDLIAYKRFTESSLLSHLNIERIYGTNRTIIVTREGHVYVCGSNCQGELCLDPLEYGQYSCSNSISGSSSSSSGGDENVLSSCNHSRHSSCNHSVSSSNNRTNQMLTDENSSCNAPCPCGNDQCLRSCIATPQRVLFLENELKKRRNAKLEISCGSFHTIAYFTSTETRDLSSFYDNLYKTLCNDLQDERLSCRNHGFSDLSFRFQTNTLDVIIGSSETQKRSAQWMDHTFFLAPQTKKIKFT